jgi:hypothetical protein
MADNVKYTDPGTGTDIATDDVGGVHFQRVKLVDGTLDSTTAIPGDATNGLDVDVTRVQGTVTVAGTVSATQSGTWALGANSGVDIGDVTINNASGGSAVNIQDGGNSITVDGTVSVSGTTAVSGSISVGSALPTGTNSIGAVTQATASNFNAQVQGNVANAATDSGNPIKIGGVARTTANPTAVSAGQRVDSFFTSTGKQVIVLQAPRGLIARQHTLISSSSTETTILAAAGASIFHDMTQLVLTNQSSGQVNVTIRDATAGSTVMVISLAGNGGAVLPFNVPVTQSTANNVWTAQLSNATTIVSIFVQAVKNV